MAGIEATAGRDAPVYSTEDDPFRVATALEAQVKAIHDRLRGLVKLHGHRLSAHQILMLGAMKDGLTLGELAAPASGAVAGKNVSHNVGKLLEMGYLEKTPVMTDRRLSVLRRTEKARRMIRVARPLLNEILVDHGVTGPEAA